MNPPFYSQDFKNNTLYEQPPDREVICHASAWDFYDTVRPQTEGRFRCGKEGRKLYLFID